MGQINVTLNGRSYRLECGEGEEARVQELASFLQEKATEIAPRGSGVQQEKLLLMIALMLADDLHELRTVVAGMSAGEPKPARSTRGVRKPDSGREPAALNDPPAIAPEDLKDVDARGMDLKAGAA